MERKIIMLYLQASTGKLLLQKKILDSKTAKLHYLAFVAWLLS